MIKACTPVFVLGAGLALKLEPCRWSSILIVLVICAGTVLCSPGVADHHHHGKDSLLGVLLTVSGGAVGGLRWGLTQKACQKGVRVKPTELVRRTLPTSAASGSFAKGLTPIDIAQQVAKTGMGNRDGVLTCEIAKRPELGPGGGDAQGGAPGDDGPKLGPKPGHRAAHAEL